MPHSSKPSISSLPSPPNDFAPAGRTSPVLAPVFWASSLDCNLIWQLHVRRIVRQSAQISTNSWIPAHPGSIDPWPESEFHALLLSCQLRHTRIPACVERVHCYSVRLGRFWSRLLDHLYSPCP